MKNDKRGISPLIATVILVGLVIVIASLLWLFLAKEVRLLGEKQGAKCSAQQAAEIDFQVTKCSEESSGVTTLAIKNTGKTTITGFRVRLGDNPTTTINPDINPGEEKTTNLQATGGEVVLFPVVVEEGNVITCSEKLVEADCE